MSYPVTVHPIPSGRTSGLGAAGLGLGGGRAIFLGIARWVDANDQRGDG